MSNRIQIKRSTSNATVSNLFAGELAFTQASNTLWIGAPDGLSGVIRVGGQQTPGVLTANQALVTNSSSAIDKIIVANAVVTALTANGSVGTNGQVLVTNGTAVYWGTGTSGSNTQVQFNDSGVANATAGFTFNKISNTLAISNTITTTNLLATGTVNGAVVGVGAAFVVNTTQVSLGQGIKLSANGALGSANQVLRSDSSGRPYWDTDVGDISSVTAGNGLSGGGNTGDVTVNVLANNGIISNTTGVFVRPGTGTVVNATGVHVNSTYIGTLDANNTTYVNGKTEGNLNVNSAFYSNGSISNTFTVGNAVYFVANGNVGIGNSTPTSKLQVDGDAFISNTLQVGTNNNAIVDTTFDTGISGYSDTGYGVLGTGNQLGSIGVYGISVNGSGIVGESPYGVAGKFVGTSSNSTPLLVANAIANLFIVTHDGNVGIGNTSPIHKISVNGTAFLQSNLTLNSGIIANGSIGTAGHVLHSNGSSVYWDVDDQGVTSVTGGSGLTGSITTTGSLSVLANNGIIANSSGTFARASNGITVDSNGIRVLAGTGVYVNSSAVYIGQSVDTTSNVTFANVVSGRLTVSGNASIGTTIADRVTINSAVNSNVMPAANITYNLGNTQNRWAQVHTANLHAVTGTFDGSVQVSGDLIVSGTLTTVNVNSVVISDPMLYLAGNNYSSDLVDIGIAGNYFDLSANTSRHAGLFRDHVDGVWKLFTNLTQELSANNDVDTTDPSYRVATLNAYLDSGGLKTNSSIVSITANSTVDVSITANTLALTTALAATSGGTGWANTIDQSILVGNSSNGYNRLSLGAQGYVLQSNGSSLVYDYLDGGSF